MAAPTDQKKPHNNNEALLPKCSDTNEEAKAPKNEPSDTEDIINDCIVVEGS